MVRAMMESFGVKVLRSCDQNGRSPLHYSAFSIRSQCIISFIAQQCKEEIDVNQQDSRGRTPLHMSISSGNLAGVMEFLARGANPFIKDNEGHNALHFAVLYNRKAIIAALREMPHSDDLTTETNAQGYSPVHMGLKLGLRDIVSMLISSIELQPKNVKDPCGNNYMHLAASSGNSKALTAFLELTNAPKLLNETNQHGATPLHYASKNGHKLCIELLLNSGAMAHKSHKGVSPLMLASREGHIECVKVLYKAHPFQIDWQDDDGDTAMHYAAQGRSPSMIQQILDLGAEVAQNDCGKSFLDIIIANGSEDCGLAVVNHLRWQECLDMLSPVLEHPMLSLVRKMPNIAKAVLDRCHSKEDMCSTGSHDCGTETFNFKYLLTKSEHQEQQQHHHPDPSTTADTADTRRPPPVLARAKSKQKLLQEVAIKDLEMVDADISTMTLHRRRSTIKGQVAAAATGKKRGHSQSMEVLKRIIQYKNVDLLVHPVVSAYLKKKWHTYGWWVYLLYTGSLSMLVFSLTMFVVLNPRPALRNQGTANSSEYSDSLEYQMTNTSENTYEKYHSTQQVFRWLAVTANILFAIDTFIGLVVQGLKSVNFVDRIQVWNSFIAIILNFIFLLSPEPFATRVLPYGAGACFFTWMVLFGALEYFDILGIYVNMFFKILRTVFHVLFVCFFLLMAFALAMYVIASQVTEFSSVGFSIFSVFGYMLGEVQYSLFIEKASSTGEGKLNNSSVIILLILLLAIMMSIVMANLLIGLAVGDIEQIKMNALFKRKALEVSFFTHLDHYAPRCVEQIIAPTSWTVHHDTKWCARNLFGYVMRKVKTDVLDISEPQHNDVNNQHRLANAPPVDIAMEMSQIKSKLQEMSDLMHNMHDSRQDCRIRQKCLRWQKPQMSMNSSNSDVSMTASDFLADLV
jgi:transient receptor potential cation channel subfamily A protein 1